MHNLIKKVGEFLVNHVILSVSIILAIIFGLLDLLGIDSSIVAQLTNNTVNSWDFPYKWFLEIIIWPATLILLAEIIRYKYFNLSKKNEYKINAYKEFIPKVSSSLDAILAYTHWIQKVPEDEKLYKKWHLENYKWINTVRDELIKSHYTWKLFTNKNNQKRIIEFLNDFKKYSDTIFEIRQKDIEKAENQEKVHLVEAQKNLEKKFNDYSTWITEELIHEVDKILK